MHNRTWNKESNQNYLYDGLSFEVLAEFRDTDFSGNTNNSFGWVDGIMGIMEGINRCQSMLQQMETL